MSYCNIYSDLPITDWIQAIGISLGLPAALWGIIKLFKKDKERQKEIDSLVSLAQSQDKMIEKISEQVDFQRKQHLNSLMPFLNIIESPDNPHLKLHTFELKLHNTGKRGKFKGFEWDYSDTIEIESISGLQEYIENEKLIMINGRDSNILVNGNFSIWLLYEDLEGNQYYQRLTKSRSKFFIDKPTFYRGSIGETDQKTIKHEGTTFIH